MKHLGMSCEGEYVVAVVEGDICLLKIDVDWFYEEDIEDEAPAIVFRKCKIVNGSVKQEGGLVFPSHIIHIIEEQKLSADVWEELL